MAGKGSESMEDSTSSSQACSKEDFFQAVLELLVDPMLPSKSVVRETPSLSKHQSLAKQVHAVVLLYNYYQRRKHAEVEFLNFASFCKLAVTLRPSLMAYMKVMRRSDYTKLDDMENQLSLTEKAIMDACDICLVLDASKDVPSTEGWPISKVSVLLVDSRKENCILLNGTITLGVWSVIEKDLDVSNMSSEDAVGPKTIYKGKGTTKKPTSGAVSADEAAFSAVKEAMGFNQTDLMVLERHVIYSTSKKKTAARFYLVQCAKSFDENLRTPIRDVIDSLQGPLVKECASSWIATPVVEYFHVLPYARIISVWFSREIFSGSVQNSRLGLGDVCANSSQKTEDSCDKEEVANGCKSNKDCGVEDSNKSGTNGANTESPKLKNNDSFREIYSGSVQNSRLGLGDVCANSSQKAENSCDKEEVANGCHSNKDCGVEDLNKSGTNGANTESPKLKNNDSFGGSRGMDGKEARSKKFGNPIKVYRHQKRAGLKVKVEVVDTAMNACVSDCIVENVETGDKICSVIPCDQGEHAGDQALVPFQLDPKHVEKVDMMDSVMKSCVNESRDEQVDAGKKICRVIPSDQGVSVGNHALIPSQLDSKYLEEVQVTLGSKENELSQTALRALHRKRDKLCRHLRNLQDEIAVCDKNIQTILDGGENGLALKIEAIIDGCNDVGLESERQTQDRTPQQDQGSLQKLKRKRLEEAVLILRNPCQELDEICRQNNWPLPTYSVTPSDGGFLANVIVKGMDFECSGGSSLRAIPSEARESAATKIISRLRDMAGKI